jgi:ribosomal protein L16 Arg81 hydroxylase
MAERLFDELVAPITAEDFLRDHWRREALYIPADPRRFRTLGFDRQTYARLVAGLASTPRDISARFVDRAGVHHAFTVRSEYFDSIVAAGITVWISAIDDMIPALAEQCRTIEAALDTAGRVAFNCWVAPPGGGSGTRFDATDVFTVQFEGENTWWFGPTPALASPPIAVAATTRGDWERLQRLLPDTCVEAPETTAFVERTLRPGDVLYLPAGTWHRTSSAAGSVSLAISVLHFDATSVFANVLHLELVRHATWRSASPARQAALREAAVVALARDAAARLSQISAARLLDATAPAPRGRPPARSQPEIQRTDWFQRVATFGFAIEPDDSGELVVTVSCGAYRLTADAANRGFFERLSATPRFMAEAALAWDAEPLDWEDVRVVLGTLLESGIIYRAHAAGA